MKQITTIYNIPHKILKEDVKQNIAENKEEQYILEYKNSNMIDFLGKVCLNDNEYNSLYINNSIYNFLNNEEIEPILKIYKVDEKAVIPSKNNYSDAGLDLTIISENKRLNSDTILYDTGIKIEIPNGYYVEIVPRSSISRSGYMLANSIGIIDQGYTGNLYVALRKINNECEDLVLPYKCCQIIMKKQINSSFAYIFIKSSSRMQMPVLTLEYLPGPAPNQRAVCVFHKPGRPGSDLRQVPVALVHFVNEFGERRVL